MPRKRKSAPEPLAERFQTLLTQVEEIVIELRALKPAVEALSEQEESAVATKADGPESRRQEMTGILSRDIAWYLAKNGPTAREVLANWAKCTMTDARQALGVCGAVYDEISMQWYMPEKRS